MSKDMLVEACYAMIQVPHFLRDYSAVSENDEIKIKSREPRIPIKATLTYDSIYTEYDVLIEDNSFNEDRLSWVVSDSEVESGMSEHDMLNFVNWLDLSLFNFARRVARF